MALLIDIRNPEWMTEEALRDRLAPLMPNVPILCGPEEGDLSDVRMAAVSRLYPGMAERLPKLDLVQKLGAGVESILDDPALPPQVRVARIVSDMPADEIAQYCLAYALRFARNMPAHEAAQREGRWEPLAPRRADTMTVAVLGLGQIGGRTARLFAATGFRTLGWSRTPKTLEGVACRAGMETLPAMLGEADVVAAILPATAQTRGLFDAALLARMKPGAVLVNAGRGDLIVDDDLLAALDAGTPGHAVLDVFHREPLPAGHPFWRHPQVTVTPHVSGWHIDDGLPVVAENYRRLIDGRPLLNEVDRTRGY